MNENEYSEVEKSLELLKGTNKRSRFFLRRVLGKETDYMEINGHIFIERPSESDSNMSTWCQDGGCEMSHPRKAEYHDCPTPLEGLPCDDYERRDRKRREWEDEHNWNNP